MSKVVNKIKAITKEAYHTENPQDGTCDICRQVTKVVSLGLGEAVYTLPEECGTGYLKKVCVGQSTAIVVYDFLFQRGMTMKAMSTNEALTLNFYLGAPFQWGLGGARDKYTMERGESCIFPRGAIDCSGRYEPGLRYQGVSIKLYPDRYQPVFEYLRSADLFRQAGQFGCPKYKMTGAVTALVRQITNYPFTGVAESLYVEGKILELIAVYINEMMQQKEKRAAVIKLSREDIQSLQCVKEMLDKYFVEPMTISELSKLVYINEYKLKAGFKKVYGKPIYSYIIDRRMDAAKQLLDEKRMKVKDAASMVGYTNISHFIETFRRKFGVNPGKLS